MNLEDLAAEFIAPLEAAAGPVLTAYQDIAGVWTIGYGTTRYVANEVLYPVVPGLVWTAERCMGAFAEDLEETIEAVVAANLHHPWSDNQIVALTSLCYNLGMTAFRSSSVLRLHNQGRQQEAALSFQLWDRAHVDGTLVEVPGLLDRRRVEAARYLTP